MFCPKCGSLLIPKKEGNKKVVVACSCGYSTDNTDALKMKETLAKSEELPVIEEDIQSLPLVDAECEKCHHNKAYFWLVQTRAGDESETRFFKCEKCRRTWREYD
jgi:transcription factor S